MSDWWSRKLNNGGQAPPQQPRPGSTPPLPQAAPRPVHLPPQYVPTPQPAQPQQYPQQELGEEVLPEGVSANELVAHNQQRLATKQYREIPKEAVALKRVGGGTCPECGSGNYLSTTVGNRPHEHCYDCGYPIVQAGSGMGALGGGGIIATGGTHQAQSPVYTQQLGG